MQLSENILVIESLSVMPEETFHGTMTFKGEMKAEIQFICPVTGNKFRTLNISTKNKGYSQEDAIKKAIQDFMIGDVDADITIYNKSFECRIHNKVNYIDIQVGEPYKSLFEQLFDLSKWEMPKQQIA